MVSGLKFRTKIFLIAVFLFSALCTDVTWATTYEEIQQEINSMMETTGKNFTTVTFNDGKNNVECNIFFPENYSGKKKYPLVVFLSDGRTIGKETTAPLKNYGALIWATPETQAKHECIVLVPQFPELLVDNKNYSVGKYFNVASNLIQAVAYGYSVDTGKIYLVGQSMGAMAAMLMAMQNPKFFAAEIFVSGQWDIRQLRNLSTQKFFNVVSEGDSRAYQGQYQMMDMLKQLKIRYTFSDGWDAQMEDNGITDAINTLLTGRAQANFISFRKGTVLPKTPGPNDTEHNCSFQYAFRFDALREWLFRQSTGAKQR